MFDWLARRGARLPIGAAEGGGFAAEDADALPDDPPSDEPRFSHGYEARLKISFGSGRRVGRLSVFFIHEDDPFARPIAFVETEDQRKRGSKTGMTLVSWFSDDLPTGRYRLQGGQAVYLGGTRDGEDVLVSGLPTLSFVLTDRRGKAAKPLPNVPRVTGATWE